VTGTGSGGRITRDDILHVVRSGSTALRAPGGPLPVAGPSDEFGPVRTEKISRIRRTIAEKMHLSWTSIPRVTNFDDADITDLEEFRNESKEDYAKQGIKLTSLPFVVKAVAMALRSHPVINATINLEAGKITYKEYINIGIAVDTERGLIVPSLRDADKLSIPQIARKLQSISEMARSNSFTLEDLRGSTFTISNLGAIGGSYSTPIINVPESAILLTGRARKMPVVLEDKVAVRLMMPLSISYDHRLIDGSNAARFLNDVIAYLQAPSRLLLAP
jgi:pyruvate/2-oxoglutarate dehydrogenase complex dihydrolipoamide acyltransferase (E2) component